jgi:hypothetical protein
MTEVQTNNHLVQVNSTHIRQVVADHTSFGAQRKDLFNYIGEAGYAFFLYSLNQAHSKHKPNISNLASLVCLRMELLSFWLGRTRRK